MSYQLVEDLQKKATFKWAALALEAQAWSKHGLAVSPNVLERQFEQTATDRAWVCDITYIRTGSGWLYLAAVLDLHSSTIVGCLLPGKCRLRW